MKNCAVDGFATENSVTQDNATKFPYAFGHVVLLLKEGGRDIDDYVEKCRRNGLVTELFLGRDSENRQPDMSADAAWEDMILITDEPDMAARAASFGIAVIGYQPPNAEPLFFPSVRYVAEELSLIEDDFFNMVYMRSRKMPLTIAKTKRTVIREMEVADLPELYKLYEEPDVCRWVEPLYNYEEEERYTREYIERMYGFYGYGLWLVFDRKSGELIGRAGISNRIIDGQECQELGYIISPKRQRQGIGYEVGRAVLAYAKEKLGIRELYLCAQQENEASLRLAERLGFFRYGAGADEGKQYAIYKMNL